MEPHGVLGRLFNERVILGLVCADLDGVSAVENLGVHGTWYGGLVWFHNLNQFL
jgi:hypothetical protein